MNVDCSKKIYSLASFRRGPSLKKRARKLALKLLEAGADQKKWTPAQRRDWTNAFNALQRLAGRKIHAVAGKLAA